LIRLIPLGGLGEVGLNAMALEVEDELYLVDAGLMFPSADMPSVDVVVPDFSYVRERADKLKGVLLTHGHEDHIGALPFLLRDLNVPVYGTKLTLGLVGCKLEELGLEARLHEIHPREEVRLSDALSFEPIQVAHSIPDAVGLALRTREGLYLHTGDFKLDDTPLDGRPTDLARLAELGDEGVTCLLSDSTNAEVQGETPSEAQVAGCFERLFAQAPGRVVVALFASNLLRVQHVLDLSHRLGRRVALLGRSMQRNVELAVKLKTLQVPEGLLVPPEQAATLPKARVTVLCTGAQAEPRAALSQLLIADDRPIRAQRGDTIILSSRAIPGNERAVTALMDALLEKGVHLHYAALEPAVHVSGHASRAQQRRMLEHVRPRQFVPIHGELHHLLAHADIARSTGVPEEGILLSRDGDVLDFIGGIGKLAGTVPVGRIFASRDSGQSVNFETLEERELLAITGVVAAALVVTRDSLQVLSGPHLSARGVSREEEVRLGAVAQIARSLLDEISRERRGDEAFLREELGRSVRRAFKQELGRKPTVIPLLVYV
jgi:ribonuclease J